MRQFVRLLFIIAIVGVGAVNCDSGQPSVEPFYGQICQDGDSATQFAAILTADKGPHGALTFDTSRQEIYWSAFTGDGWKQTIYWSRMTNGALGAAEAAPFASGGQYNFGGPALTADGNRLFFSSYRPVPELGFDTCSGIWYVDRTESGWSDPAPIAATLDSTRTGGQVSVAASGNIYFAARFFSENAPRLFVVHYEDGHYLAPEPVAGEINSTAVKLDPFVDPGENYIIFTADGDPSSLGKSDLFISFRQADGTFGKAANLGPLVNSPDFDRFGSVSPDGQYLFFIRNTGATFSKATGQFLWIRTSKLSVLKSDKE